MSWAHFLATKRCVVVAAFSSCVAACAPTLKMGPQSDSAEGYRKTVSIVVDPHATKLISSRLSVAVNGQTVSSQKTLTQENDSRERNVQIAKTELVRRRDQSTIEYKVAYLSWPFNEQREEIAIKKVNVTSAAVYGLRVPKTCFAVGEKIPIALSLNPPPVRDRVNFKLQQSGPIAQCTQIRSDRLSAHAKSTSAQANCVGNVDFRLTSIDRPLLRSGGNIASIEISNAIIPPQNVSYQKGAIVDQKGEDGGPTIRLQDAVLEWTPVPGAQNYVLRLFRVRDKADMDESLLDATKTRYALKLPAGEVYQWVIRAEVLGCGGARSWSNDTAPSTVDLR